MGFTDWAFLAVLGIILGVYIWSQMTSKDGVNRFHEKLLKQSKEMNEAILKQSEEAMIRMDTITDIQTQIADLKRELEEMKEKSN